MLLFPRSMYLIYIIILLLLLPDNLGSLASSSRLLLQLQQPPASLPPIITSMTNKVGTNASRLVGFNPALSSTFEKLSGIYNVRYADGTLLKIARMQEDVFLGRLATRARMGLIIRRKDAEELEGTGGILGLGFSDAPGSASLLKTLTAPAGRPAWGIDEGLIPCPNTVACRSEHMAGSGMQKREFALLAMGDRGELQLNGHDASAAQGPVSYAAMLNESGYGVAITSVTCGSQELLNFTDASPYRYVVGFLDSGAACMSIPDGVFAQGGGVDTYGESPFAKLQRQAHGGGVLPPLVYTLRDGGTIEIPGEEWGGAKGCSMGFKEDNIMILGTPTFRHYLVVHDMTGPAFRMGFGKISPGYAPALAASITEKGVHKLPTSALKSARPLKGGGVLGSRLSRRYEVDVGFGEPTQNVSLLVDTGSVLLAVFNSGPPISQLGDHGAEQPVDSLEFGRPVVVTGSTATSHFTVADFGGDDGARKARDDTVVVMSCLVAAAVLAYVLRAMWRRLQKKPPNQNHWQDGGAFGSLSGLVGYQGPDVVSYN